MHDFNSIIVLGATATGKTKLAVSLAKEKNGEIISADSRQVYRGLDLGTGKDLEEYGSVPYYLIDIIDLDCEYNIFNFQKDVYKIFPEICRRGKLPIIAGGTALYLDSIIRGYNLLPVPENTPLRESLKDKTPEQLQNMLLALKPDIHNKTDLEQRPRLIRAIEIALFVKENPDEAEKQKALRPVIKPQIIGIKFPREVLHARIYKRLIERICRGMVDEVKNLNMQGVSWERLESLGLEYRFTAQYLQQKITSEEEYIKTLYKAICKFAKHQETWFRKMERQGIKINWTTL